MYVQMKSVDLNSLCSLMEILIIKFLPNHFPHIWSSLWCKISICSQLFCSGSISFYFRQIFHPFKLLAVQNELFPLFSICNLALSDFRSRPAHPELPPKKISPWKRHFQSPPCCQQNPFELLVLRLHCFPFFVMPAHWAETRVWSCSALLCGLIKGSCPWGESGSAIAELLRLLPFEEWFFDFHDQHSKQTLFSSSFSSSSGNKGKKLIPVIFCMLSMDTANELSASFDPALGIRNAMPLRSGSR